MDPPQLSVTVLGAGQEVGRSCCVLRYRGKTVVCDAGVHPAHHGIASLPFLDELDWSTVDAVLITHFHLDHAAGLTYIMEKTNFRDGKGKVYMTHATKAVYKFIMQDYLRMSSSSTEPLFSPLDFSLSFASIVTVSAHQLISPCPGVSFTPFHAGHVLGACMFLIDLAGLKILYTGDYSREEDRHLVRAQVPAIRPDVLIVESTYGVQKHQELTEREERFTALVHAVVKRGGHVLLPAFALGRAQDILLILEDYWSRNPDLHSVPIYYVSSLAKKCMAVYQTYIHTMNANIRNRFSKQDNPFIFKFITNLPQTRGAEKKVAEGPPCVVLASPGFMDNGSSRELLELWAPDARNAVIITGYSVEGTMARDIQNSPDEIISLKGNTIQRRLTVEVISFSAHVDGEQNLDFIEQVKAQHIVLVHGEAKAMFSLKTRLEQKYSGSEEEVHIHMPWNTEVLNLAFRGDRIAKAIGILAEKDPAPNTMVQGLLLSKDYTYTLLDPRDLGEFTGLSTSVVVQTQRIAISVGLDLVRWHLEGMFGSVVDGVDADHVRTLRVMGCVDIKHTREDELTLEWESSVTTDMIADSTLALILGIDSSPASVKLTLSPHSHSHVHADQDDEELMQQIRFERLAAFLESHFGYAEIYLPEEDVKDRKPGEDQEKDQPAIIIRVDDLEARIDPIDFTVECPNEALKSRVQSVVHVAATTISSLAEAYGVVDISNGPILEKNISEARFLDDEEYVKDEAEVDEMKVEI
ncbi:Metallo-hydrolase/oxidoreductase [Serendipita vermifera]|nr:Metallo-hydrolase/oxidoreductase [Serendipita vermifera]